MILEHVPLISIQNSAVIAGLDPAIHPLKRNDSEEDEPPELGFTRVRTIQVRKSDKSDLRGQARG
jgi:hypothetical protein